MKKVLLLFTVFLSFWAAESALSSKMKTILKTEKLPNGNKKISLDLNQDGKADTFQVFRNDQMITQESESKYNGIITEWISYSDFVSENTPIEVTRRDTNGDGKVDYVESVYKVPSRQKLITTFEQDSTFTGSFDKTWTNVTEMIQKKDQFTPCENAIPDEPIVENLVKSVNKVQTKMDDGFVANEYGYRIHKSCLDNWGVSEFTNAVNETAKKGFSCLEKLAKKNEAANPATPNGAKKNLMGMIALLQTSGISVVCGERDYKWDGIAGHASTSPADSIKNPKVKHPFVSINPNEPKKKMKSSQEEKNQLVKTLFHEQLHNLGIKHNESSIEYPYTCETCCLPASDDKKEEIDLACKICSGVYDNNKDEKYLRDMIAWSKAAFNEKRAEKAIIAFQQSNPGSRFGLFAYAEAASGIFSPVGIEVAKILKEKFQDRSADENLFIERSLDNEYFDHNKKASKYAKIIANAHVALFYDQDESKVLSYVQANKAVLKEMIKFKSSAKGNDKYVMETVSKQMDDILGTIWMKGYPQTQGPKNQKAYELMKEIGFLK